MKKTITIAISLLLVLYIVAFALMTSKQGDEASSNSKQQASISSSADWLLSNLTKTQAQTTDAAKFSFKVASSPDTSVPPSEEVEANESTEEESEDPAEKNIKADREEPNIEPLAETAKFEPIEIDEFISNPEPEITTPTPEVQVPEPNPVGGPDTQELDLGLEPIEYPWHAYVNALVFWVGEEGAHSNNFQSHKSSAWIDDWVSSFGGLDNPGNRCGFKPCGFQPRENPFYVALPYNHLNEAGQPKPSVYDIPWYSQLDTSAPLAKGAWLEMTYQGKACYAQWEDVGPLETDDFDYVFGVARPKNLAGNKDGIAVSPGVRDCLGLRAYDSISWRFIDQANVPPGPWKKIITS